MAAFTLADWIILAVIFLSAFISLLRGFVKEAFSLTAWALAFFVAIAFHQPMMAMLEGSIEKFYMREIVAYVVLFGAALVAGTLMTNAFSLLVKKTGLGGTDRMLGMVFGATRGLVLVLALVILLPSMLTDIEQGAWWRDSQLIPQFEMMSEWSKTTFSEIVEAVSNFINEHRGGSEPAGDASSAPQRAEYQRQGNF